MRDDRVTAYGTAAAMLGDIFTCLLVSFRLFFVAALVVNVLVWLFFDDDDDDDENAARPVQRIPDGPPRSPAPCCSPVCTWVRGRRPPPRVAQNDESAPSATGVVTLLADVHVVEKLSASEETDHEDDRSIGADGTSVEDEETESIEPETGTASDLHESDVGGTQLAAEDGQENAKMLEDQEESDELPSSVTRPTEQHEPGANVKDEWFTSNEDDQVLMMENAASDANRSSQRGAAVSTAVAAADSDDETDETPKETPSTPQHLARRPASHW